MGKINFCVFFVLSVFICQCRTQEVLNVTESDLSVIPLKHESIDENIKIDVKSVTIDIDENIDYYDGDEVDAEGNTSTPTDFKNRFATFTGKIVTMMINVTLDLEEFTTITSENFPNPYPTTENTVYEWYVGIGDGYGVDMVIRTLDLAENDYLLLRPGGVEQPADKQIVFSHQLDSERKFKLFHLDELYLAFQVNARATNDHQGFQIDFRRVGIRPTTELPTSTVEPPVIVEPMNESTLFLGGRTPMEFLNVSDEFKLQLAHVAEIYCLENNITIDENVTILDNVNYHLITQCTLEWPGSETCVRIVYSIGVSYNNETNEYELSGKNLDNMWLNYKHLFNLSSIGVVEYFPPNNDQVLMTWIIVSCVVIVLFVVLIIVTSKYNCFNEFSGRDSMRSSLVSQKLTNASLFPTPHQTVPPFYGMDYYSPEDDQFWAKDEELPPKYSGMTGERNAGFVHDDEILDLYSEEIVMSLPDVKEQIQFRMKDGPEKFNTESTL